MCNDPEGIIGNPRGLENDLNRDENIKVSLYVRPLLKLTA